MADGRHFGSPIWVILDDRISLSIAFLAISDQYSTFVFTNWRPAAILDDRKSLLIAISDQYATSILFYFFHKNGCRRPLWMTENHFQSHFSQFQIYVCWSLTSLCHSNGHIETMPAREINPFTALTRIRSQFLRTQWRAIIREWTRLRVRPLSHQGWLISDLYATFVLIFFSKWPPAAILEVRFVPFWMTENHFRSHFSPFQINTQLFFLHKMAPGGHFRWPKITFDRISRHFRSIRNFFFFHKIAAGAHFGWAKITFDRILEVRFGPFWMTKDHFRSHFSPFQINTPLEVRFAPRTIGFFHYACVINGYAKYEVDRRPFCFFWLMPKIIGFL